jgi:hypothetical protein
MSSIIAESIESEIAWKGFGEGVREGEKAGTKSIGG